MTSGFVATDAPESASHVSEATKHLGNVVLTIYGGASEIQKNIIAQRALGLPKIR